MRAKQSLENLINVHDSKQVPIVSKQVPIMSINVHSLMPGANLMPDNTEDKDRLPDATGINSIVSATNQSFATDITRRGTTGHEIAGHEIAGHEIAGHEIAGYIRCSRFVFPATCQEAAARATLVAQFSFLRQSELRQIAAEAGQVINAWYEDIDRSGRAEYQDTRKGFEAMTLAARTRRLSRIFVWDLSRLFRDLVGQELWLQEMEALGVIVHIQDLPFAADAATRRLLRQEIGMINEYQSARLGSLLSAMLNLRVEQGLYVGRTYSQWGLNYDANTKGFLLDEATAPLICRLFEQFNAANGSASRLTRNLNAAISSGAPNALHPPRSKRWDVTKVLLHIRDPLYRRRTSYNGTEYEMPHLIPEVVAPAVLATADAFLVARQEIYDQCAMRCAAPPDPYLYARILRCLKCGGAMQAYPKQGINGPHPGLRILWICSDALRGGQCDAGFYLPQPRLTVLLERALRQAFLAARLQMDTQPLLAEEALIAAQQRARERKRLNKRIGKYDWRRGQWLESYALGLITDRSELERHLTEISNRRKVAQAAQATLQALDGSDPLTVRWKESRLGQFQERFEVIWPGSEWLARDPAKSQFLKEVGLRITLHLHSRPTATSLKTDAFLKTAQAAVSGALPAFCLPAPGELEEAPRGRGASVPRQRSGLCELEIVCPRLGIEESAPLKLWETEEELQNYRTLLKNASMQNVRIHAVEE